MRADILAITLCLLLAGCTGPAIDDPNTSSHTPAGSGDGASDAAARPALAGWDQARQAAEAADPGLRLAWISGTEASDEGGPPLPTGQARTWTYAFVEPDDGRVFLVDLGPGGTDTRWKEATPRFDAQAPGLPTETLLDTPRVAQALGEAVRTSGASWDQASYWLSPGEDGPVWHAVARLSSATTGHVRIDATDGQTLEPNPGLGSDAAWAKAERHARTWHEDAQPIAAYAAEVETGGTQAAELGALTLHGLVVPPDPVPRDGRAPAWWFLFEAPDTTELLPVQVAADGPATAGAPIPTDSPSDRWIEETSVTAAQAVETVAGEAGLPPNVQLVYHLVPTGQGPLWRIGQDRGDATDWWLVDAQDGTLIGAGKGTATGQGHPGRQATADLEGTYTLVWVHGHEVHDPPEEDRSCSTSLDHDVHLDERVLQYNNDTYPFDPAGLTSVIAFSYWQRPAGCPLAYQMSPGASQATATLGRHGDLTVDLAGNGTAHVPGQGWLDPGENLTITYTDPTEAGGWINGTITVDHLGHWPRSGLWPLPAG